MRVLDVDDDTEFLEQQVSEAGRRGATAVSAGAVFGGVTKTIDGKHIEKHRKRNGF